MPLLKSVIKPLGLLGLTAASSAVDVQILEDSKILLKGVRKTIKNETKEQKGGFLSMLLGTLGAKKEDF